jgi:hypothetical protein
MFIFCRYAWVLTACVLVRYEDALPPVDHATSFPDFLQYITIAHITQQLEVKCVEEERNFRGLCTITVTVMGIS